MTITAPTRITIEVHPGTGPGADGSSGAAVVRVIPEPLSPAESTTTQSTANHPDATSRVVAAEPRIEQPAPAAYDPGECRCLDDEDCAADHANE